jgi:hypothetical protein
LRYNLVQYCSGRWISDFQYFIRYVIIFAIYSCPVLKWKMNTIFPVFCKISMLLMLPYNPVQYCNGRWLSDFQYSVRSVTFSHIDFNIHYNSVRYIVILPYNPVHYWTGGHHSNEINNKWKPLYYCWLYMIYNT